MTKHRLAIIGNGMATGRLLDDLARRGGLRAFDVAVFGEEPHGAYNRILLGRVLAGGGVDDITLKPRDWYAANGVTFHAGAVVTRLSHASRRLWTADGAEHYFDAAVLATGSVPRMPSIDGLRRADGALKAGVFAYRTVADVEKMRAHATPGGRAAVVGGGLLGLEAAKGLADLGMRPTVVHGYDTLLNRQVDKVGGQFVRRAVEKLGIAVRLSANTRAVLGRDRVEGLEFGGGDRLPADLVVFAAGVKPRTDLARDADVPCNSGIVVDDRLETGLPGVYAVGDCAEHDGQVYGLVQPVYEQCAVLADVLTGANPGARYRGSKVYTKLKVAGVEVASMGVTDPDGPDDEVVQVVEEKRGVYRKLIVRGDKLAGAVLVGDAGAAAALVRRFERGDPVPANRLDLLASPDRAAAGPAADESVCKCHNVSGAALAEAVRGGCRSIADLGARTGAGTGCGSCRGQLAALLLKAPKPAAV